MSNFSKLIWKQCEILHNTAHAYTDKCIIGIPVYKSTLTETEKASLNQLCKIIGHSYEICLICPDDIQLNDYVNIAYNNGVYLSFLFCAKDYFKSTENYSYLCETAEFYKCFKEYDYLFIYQLDGWIFSNLLYYYINLNVDYIGGLWGDGHKESIGNGGVSLRRVQKFIDICEGLTEEDYKKDYVKQEDIFFCETLRNKAKLKFPSLKNASNFALTNRYQYFIQKYNNNHLPMCLHAWDKSFNDVMKNHINITYNDGSNITNQEINSENLYDFSSILKLQKKQRKPIVKKENVVVKNEDEKQIQFRSEIKRRQMPKIEIPQQTIANNINKDWKQILNINKSNNNWKLTNKLVENNTYTVTPKKQEYTFDPTTFEEIKITHQKRQHQIKEQPIEYKEKRVVDNRKINILIVHYNTPYLTECLIKSINKFVGKNCVIYIFDSSDTCPFTYKQDNIVILDNTHNQIIDFEKELEKYPNKGKEGSHGRYISYRHCITIDKCFDIINDNFILLDSDVLLKQDIRKLYDENYYCSGEITLCFDNKTKRLAPFCCFINVKKCLQENIRYFDESKMHGLHENDSYDTGAAFYLKMKESNIKHIKLDDYIIHYKGASWGIHLPSNMKHHGQLLPEQWVNLNKQYWKSENDIKLYGMTLIYNEAKVIPYIMPYYERLGFDKLVVYDNESTDNSVELLKQYPFVEIHTFQTHNRTSNRAQSELKNEFFKRYNNIKNAWLYISDFDEVIYYDGVFKDYLKKLNDTGYNYLNQTMCEIISDEFPKVDDTLVHEKCVLCNVWDTPKSGGSKLTLFKAGVLDELTYSPGAHSVSVKTDKVLNSLNHKDIKSFHIKYIDFEYCKQKNRRAWNRRSQEDLARGWGKQYKEYYEDDAYMGMWEKLKEKSVMIQDYIDNKIKFNEEYEQSTLIVNRPKYTII